MNKQLRQALIKWASAIDNELWEERYGEDISKEDALAALGLVEEVCKNCANWDDGGWRENGYRNCYSAKIVNEPHDVEVDDCLMYWDFVGTGYQANFCTGRRFGCVHWKERNDEP